MRTIVIYHKNCLDGLGAQYAAYLSHPNSEFVAAEYEDKPITLDQANGNDIYIVDFSYKADIIKSLATVARSITILDHHKTAKTDLERSDFPSNVKIIFDMERSGAGITWDYFNPDRKRPAIIDYIEDRDIWTWKLPNTKEINARIQLCTNLADIVKLQIELDVNLESVANIGKMLLLQQQSLVNKICESASMASVMIDGRLHKVIMVNTSILTSEVGNELLIKNPEADFAICYFDKSTSCKWWSLRANGKIDVGLIAKNRGGGGHANAARFTTNCNWSISNF